MATGIKILSFFRSSSAARALKGFVGCRASRRSTHEAPVQIPVTLCWHRAPFSAYLQVPLILVRSAQGARHPMAIASVEKMDQNKTERKSSSLLCERIKKIRTLPLEKEAAGVGEMGCDSPVWNNERQGKNSKGTIIHCFRQKGD